MSSDASRGTGLFGQRVGFVFSLVTVLFLVSWSPLHAQGPPTPTRPRATQAIDDAQLTTLRGNTHPLARTEFDQGVAPPTLPMERILLVLKRSPEQETQLRALLQSQQDKSSPNYHQWLTPDQFGQRFGLAPEDVQVVTSWLQSRGFQVSTVGRGLTAIEFSGTAGQVQDAFHTEVHRYEVNGEQHWANASDPQIPAALAPVITGLNALHNFPKRPAHHAAGLFSKSRTNGHVARLNPEFTYQASDETLYAMAPADFATIYNVTPLWTAGLDGTGQSIAIVGQSDINIDDVRSFRSLFSLPPNDPQIIVNGPDPGLLPGDETESDLDVEWSGAVAKGATIKFVTSESTNSDSGVDLSAFYVIDNDLAPVMGVSYQGCEPALGEAGNQFIANLWEQASAEGITVVVAAGDAGSAGCDPFVRDYAAESGLAVNGLASTPFNVAVGGTDFNDANKQQIYWNTANNSQSGSAKGYIPEIPWNDSCANPELSYITSSSSASANCNDLVLLTDPNYQYLNTLAAGGGPSRCATHAPGNGTCQGYPKPTWQAGPGVPSDGVRDLPDVSLFSSDGFNSSFYVVCEADQDPNEASCDLNSPYADFLGIGGTSAATPTFAALLAIINQFTGSSGQGIANYTLYNLAANHPSVFNDVTSGSNAVPCLPGTSDCVTPTTNLGYGVISDGSPATPAYSAGAGYDLATGLGSVSAYSLVHSWQLASFLPTTTSLTLNNSAAVNIVHGQSVPVSVIVTPQPPAAGTPTGDVSLLAHTQSPASEAGDFTLTQGQLGPLASTVLLPGGNSYEVTAHYAGNGTFGASDSPPISVTVLPEDSAITVAADGLSIDGLSPLQRGAYGTLVYVRADVSPAAATETTGATPTGSVTFTDTFNGTPLTLFGGPYPLNSQGYAAVGYGVFTFTPGSHVVTASYGGDASFNPSGPAPAASFTIAQAQTQTQLESNTLAVTPTTPFTLTATISTAAGYNPLTGAFGGAATPTGTITFYVGSAQLGSPVAVTGSVNSQTQTAQAQASATFNGTTLSNGFHNISAIYGGDANYATSVAVPIAVDAGYPTATIVSSPNVTVSQGTNVTFTASVTSTQIGGPPISGTVQFQVDGADYGNPIAVGQAQFSIANLPVGSHLIGAAYSGDNNYVPSVGSATETVTTPPPADFLFSTDPPNLPPVNLSAPGDMSTPVTLSLTAENGFDGTVTFSPASCTIAPTGSLTSCNFSPASVTGTGDTEVTLQTTAPQGSVTPRATDFDGWWVVVVFWAVSLWFLAALRRAMGRRPRIAYSFLILALLLTCHGCGGGAGTGSGGGSGGTPTTGTPTNVTYTVTVQATSGTINHSVTFTFLVQ